VGTNHHEQDQQLALGGLDLNLFDVLGGLAPSTPAEHYRLLHFDHQPQQGTKVVAYTPNKPGNRWHKLDPDNAHNKLGAMSGQDDVFLSHHRFGGNGWRILRNLRELTSFFIDIDDHDSENPDSWAIAQTALDKVEELRLPRPSWVTYTGRGCHLVWRFHTTPGHHYSTWYQVQKRLAELLSGDHQALDGSRVLRATGSVNSKTGHMTSIEILEPIVYRFEDLVGEIIEYDIEEHDCPECSGKLIRRFNKDGRAFWGCSNHFETNCSFTASDHKGQPALGRLTLAPKDTEKHHECPACGSLLVMRSNANSGRRFWGCSSYHEMGCSYTALDRQGSPAEGKAGGKKRNGTIYDRWMKVYHDLHEILDYHWSEGIPPSHLPGGGHRDQLIYHIANAASWFTDPDQLEEEVAYVIERVLGHHASDSEVRKYIPNTGSVVRRSKATTNEDEQRYRYKRTTLYEEFVALIPEDLLPRLRAIISDETARKRAAERESMRDRVGEGRYKMSHQDRRDRAEEIRAFHAQGYSQIQLADKYGLSRARISQIVKTAPQPIEKPGISECLENSKSVKFSPDLYSPPYGPEGRGVKKDVKKRPLTVVDQGGGDLQKGTELEDLGAKRRRSARKHLKLIKSLLDDG
jgi:ssDNA-binding Zn-finger/Zn-ribbon topoisomerase 1